MKTYSRESTSLVQPFFDFWLLGGASIVVWFAMISGQVLRGHYEFIETRFAQTLAAFGLLNLVCNFPHFVISYRFGYGRGWRFIRKHSLSLIFVPLALIALYAFAYFDFHAQIADSVWVTRLNAACEFVGLGFRFGQLSDLGMELVSGSVWLMYLTVGWHYSKQVFGCMMVYAHYRQYPISKSQRWVLKSSVFSIAFFNFSYLTSSYVGKMEFFDIPLTPLGLPDYLLNITAAWVAVSALGVFYWIFYKNYRDEKKTPHPCFVIPWVAFHLWWIPFIRQPEYLMMAVPFFHSLQYLPFVYRIEKPHIKKGDWYYPNAAFRLVMLCLIGFAAFELIPGILDESLNTAGHQVRWFFLIAFIVSINIHHFFIDSVVWKFTDPEIRKSLLTEDTNEADPFRIPNKRLATRQGLEVNKVAEIAREF